MAYLIVMRAAGRGLTHLSLLLLLPLIGGCACNDARLQQVEECRTTAAQQRPEVCNDRDDDCDCLRDSNGDGTICGPGDEGVDETCDLDGDRFCASTVPVEGRPLACAKSFDFCAEDGQTCVEFAADCDDRDPDVNPGAAEACDGLDNNCNGKADLDDPLISDPRLGQRCGEVPPEKAGIGECRYGKTACENGAVLCKGAAGVTNETCNGKDDDCNGVTDEGAASFELCWSPANPLVGECKPGVYVCSGGKIDRTRCLNEVLPVAEQCNGKDEDCDGQIDDGARSNNPVYVLFHLDCSGSMDDKISQIKTFLNDLNTLPSVYQSSQIRFGLALYPESSSAQLPWVHQTYTDLNTFRGSLASVSTSGCGWFEPGVDSVAFGLCSSRPTTEWAQSSQCRTLYDSEWNRCGGANGTASAHPAGSICRSILTGGYLTSRIFDLPVPDAAHQLHVLITDEELQSHKSLNGTSADAIKQDVRAKYSTAGWSAKIRVACFLSSSYATQFSPLCDKTYSLSSSTTSSQMMTDFTAELKDIYCQ